MVDLSPVVGVVPVEVGLPGIGGVGVGKAQRRRGSSRDASAVLGETPVALAAALSAKKRIVPRELGITELQEALRNDGVDLDMAEGSSSGS